MKSLVMPAKRLNEFIRGLKKFGQVHAPVKKDEIHVYAPLRDIKQLDLSWVRTLLPLKKYLLPPQEKLLEYTLDGEVKEPEIGEEKIIIFGAHPCEIWGVNILDEVFSYKIVDKSYFRRRNNLIIIGYSCTPDDKCFCQSMGTDTVSSGFDLFFSELNGDYLVGIGSSVGERIISANARLFRPVTREDIEKYRMKNEERRSKFTLHLEVSDLPTILGLEYESEIWEDLGELCVGCGSCSLVCPTCYCFNVRDIVDLDMKTCKRIREWDNCMLKDYALVAGGHNFRGQRADRVKNRYYHKQQGFVEQFGRPSCVGCGRCIVSCPVKINVVEVFQKIRGEEYGERKVSKSG